jgi:hypothetical protein
VFVQVSHAIQISGNALHKFQTDTNVIHSRRIIRSRRGLIKHHRHRNINTENKLETKNPGKDPTMKRTQSEHLDHAQEETNYGNPRSLSCNRQQPNPLKLVHDAQGKEHE